MAKIIPGKDGSKKDAITRRAATLFRRKGFTATSMRDIARSMGVEAPSLYNHIESKHAILQDLCFSIADLFTANLKKVENSKASYLSKIESIIRFHISMMMEEFESVYISDHEWKHLPEPFLGDFKARRRNYRSRLAAILQKGIRNKEISAIDPHIAVLTVLSAISGIESWQRSSKKRDANSLGENMVTILVAGLRHHALPTVSNGVPVATPRAKNVKSALTRKTPKS
jgi:TetR/AcrR family transcriptional regulator, cholesterol catabolism regulator